MLTRRQFLVLTGATGVAAAGAVIGYRALPGDDEGGADGPPTIAVGRDSCDHCNMLISDVRFAAAWREPSGKVARFDDIGCMTGMLDEAPPPDGTTFWVHDYLDESPIDAHLASFVIAPATITTPMASGLVAVATASSANTLAKDHHSMVHNWHSVLATEHGGH